MPAVASRSRRSTPRTSSFRRSTHIERDWRERPTTANFILTTCARATLQRLLAGLAPNSTQRAWTLTGPYGTGKSSFCLFAATLLSPNGVGQTKQARRQVAQADKTISQLLQSEFGTSKGVVPILVTGSRERLQAAISRALAKLLRARNVSGASRIAAELVAVAASTPDKFLASFEKAIGRLVEATRGALGAILILDELGKFLEYAAANPTEADVYLLQQLAEMASREGSNIAVLGVLHQDFSGYAKALQPSQQHEWEKVRGRFEDVVFEQSSDDMLRLIADAISCGDLDVNPSATDRMAFRELCSKSASLTQGAQGRQRGDLLEQCLPLHPITASLLGPVFKRFGQNERSAFSFIRSAEPSGLPDFVSRRPRAIFRLVELYQYLTGVFGDALLSGRDGRRWAEAFSVEAQNPTLSETERDVLHTIALLSIVGRWHGLLPTADVVVLSLAPGATRKEVQDAIRSLQAQSAVVFRKYNGTYALWEGSDIDVEAKIAEARAGQAGNEPPTHMLRTLYAPRPLVARRHSFERGTLRYFDVIPISPTLPGEAADAVAQSRADGHIFVLLHDQPDPRRVPLDAMDVHSAAENVIICVPKAASEVDALSRELAAIDNVQQSLRELHNDRTALREINARKEEVRQQLDDALADLLTPTKRGAHSTRWLHMGRDVPITSRRQLNERLSDIFDSIYRDCPKIHNEIINRRELSSSAAAAQGELLKAMVAHGDAEHLGIEKHPPSKSIYLSVLETLGLHRKRDDRWEFSTGPVGLESSARQMMKAVRQFLDESEAAARSIADLSELLRRPPFGVRDGVIPIIVCAALLAHEADVALYEGGRFVPQLDDAILERLLKSPESFAVRRWHVAGVRATVFEQLAQMLGRSAVAKVVQKRDLLDVVRPLMRFVRRLNEFSRATKSFSPVALAVREALLEATEPDQLLFTALPAACGLPPFVSRRAADAASVQKFRQALQSALTELQKGYDTLLHALIEDLATALESPREARGIRAALRARAGHVAPYAISPGLRVFCDRLADATAADNPWIESIASFLAGKHPSEWIDEDRARMSVRLTQIAAAFRSLETIAIERHEQAVRATDESLQLAVAGTAFPEARLVVHVTADELKQVAELERQIRTIIERPAANGARRLVMAALARVVRSALDPENSSPALTEVTA